MYKLLIVDDFFVERENAKSIINKSGLDIEIIGDCTDGIEALELIKNEMPDFVLADIEMPIMNGLELADKVKNLYPDTKIAFFSYHNKFEYAKKAIDLSAYAYILKPIEHDELITLVTRLITEKKQEDEKLNADLEVKRMLHESRPVAVEKFKRDLITERHTDKSKLHAIAEFWSISIPFGHYTVLVFDAESIFEAFDEHNIEMKEISSVKIISALLGASASALISRITENRWAVLSCGESNQQAIQQAIDTALYAINALSKDGIVLSAGISLSSENILDIHTLFRQSVRALEFKFNFGKGRIMQYSDIEFDSDSLPLDLNKILLKLKDSITSGDAKKVHDMIEEVFSFIPQNVHPSRARDTINGVVTCLQIILGEMNFGVDMLLGSGTPVWQQIALLDTMDEMHRWITELMTKVVDHISPASRSNSQRIVENVCDFIEKNYFRKLSVRSIAERMHYNPNYLNNAFKQATGETILQYITYVRMEKAKGFLATQPTMKIADVCSVVGYGHDAYFRAIFQEYVGMGPREYRDQIQKSR